MVLVLASCSKSVICTPEVIKIPLKIGQEQNQERVQRFVLASDGLWDVTENDAVGKVAARHPMAERRKSGDCNDRIYSSSNNATTKFCSPKVAAARILQECLEAGGNRDDITICVVDVSYW